MNKLALSMNTRVTDTALLASFGLAAFQDHAGLVFTIIGGLFVGVIRWQQHRQTIKNMRLDEALKREELNQLKAQNQTKDEK